jgi:hypothetical protein
MILPAKKLMDMYIIQNAVISNSETIAIGDAVIINTSAPHFNKGAKNTTGIVLGTVISILNGGPAGSVYLQETKVTVASDNQTNAQTSVDILASSNLITYVADLSAVAGTTTNSQYFGYFNLSATLNGTLDESSYSASSEKQFLSIGVNPGNSSQVLGCWTKIAQA